MNTQPEALRLADALEGDYSLVYRQPAATELRRLHDVELHAKQLERGFDKLHALNQELLQTLERIATAAEATVCNPEWIAKHARSAIAKAEAA